MQLRGPIQDPWPAIGRDSALIKFALIIVGLCVVIAATVVLVLRRRAQPAMVPPPPIKQPAVPAPPSVDTGIRPMG
jgi:hypothetical protein